MADKGAVGKILFPFAGSTLAGGPPGGSTTGPDGQGASKYPGYLGQSAMNSGLNPLVARRPVPVDSDNLFNAV